MTEILPIVPDKASNNAKRFLKLHNDVLLINGARTADLSKQDINPDDSVAVARVQSAIDDAFTDETNQFMGAFIDTEDSKKRLAGAIEVAPVDAVDLQPFMTPLEWLTTRRLIKNDDLQLEGNPMGIFALVAENGPTQLALLADLLDTATHQNMYESKNLFIPMPTVHPAKDLILYRGFTRTGRPGNMYGIEHTLFVRNTD